MLPSKIGQLPHGAASSTLLGLELFGFKPKHNHILFNLILLLSAYIFIVSAKNLKKSDMYRQFYLAEDVRFLVRKCEWPRPHFWL